MIVNVLPDRFQAFAKSHSFRPWQTGLLTDIFQSKQKSLLGQLGNLSEIKLVSLGHGSGHTYFAQACCLNTFPVRTKVFSTGSDNMSEYMTLILRPKMCHEPIGIMSKTDFEGYVGGNVKAVIVDLNGSKIFQYRNSLHKLIETIPAQASLILMDSYIL